MDLGLKGKAVLVTGSSRGLGYATALQFAKEGARVAVNSRSAESTEKAAAQIRSETGAEVIALPGDVTTPEAAEALVRGVVEAFGGLDIIITNAGGPPPGPFEAHDDSAWYKAVEANLMSHVRLIRCALPYLRKSSTPSVLTITSSSVKQPIRNLVLSNSVRAAAVGLTKTLSIELAAEGIRFNSILPGWTETERVTHLLGDRAKTNNTTVEQEAQKLAAEIPLGRIADPQEFANAAVFLASPAASYITGVMLTVDGGAYKGTL